MTGITNPTEEYFKDGLWGWDGTRWRKLPLLFGYTDRYAERVVNFNATGGINILDGSVVPAGEIWVINAISAVNDTRNSGQIVVYVTNGSVYAAIDGELAPTDGYPVSTICSLVLKAGDKICVYFWGCTAGDVLYLDVWGYKMAVT